MHSKVCEASEKLKTSRWRIASKRQTNDRLESPSNSISPSIPPSLPFSSTSPLLSSAMADKVGAYGAQDVSQPFFYIFSCSFQADTLVSLPFRTLVETANGIWPCLLNERRRRTRKRVIEQRRMRQL